MEKQAPAPRLRLMLVGFAIVLVAVGGLAYFLGGTYGPGQGGGARSSLSSTIASLEQVVSSQSAALQSISSQSGLITVTVTTVHTSTVTSTAGSGSGSTVTSTVTSVKNVTVTKTTSKTTTSVFTVTTSVGGADFFSPSATLTVPGGSGMGTLVVIVANQGYDQITGVNVTIPSGNNSAVDLCAATCSIQMLYNGVPVSSTAAVSGGTSANGVAQIDQGTLGTTYTLTVVVAFADGTQQTQAFQVTAQS